MRILMCQIYTDNRLFAWGGSSKADNNGGNQKANPLSEREVKALGTLLDGIYNRYKTEYDKQNTDLMERKNSGKQFTQEDVKKLEESFEGLFEKSINEYLDALSNSNIYPARWAISEAKSTFGLPITVVDVSSGQRRNVFLADFLRSEFDKYILNCISKEKFESRKHNIDRILDIYDGLEKLGFLQPGESEQTKINIEMLRISKGRADILQDMEDEKISTKEAEHRYETLVSKHIETIRNIPDQTPAQNQIDWLKKQLLAQFNIERAERKIGGMLQSIITGALADSKQLVEEYKKLVEEYKTAGGTETKERLMAQYKEAVDMQKIQTLDKEITTILDGIHDGKIDAKKYETKYKQLVKDSMKIIRPRLKGAASEIDKEIKNREELLMTKFNVMIAAQKIVEKMNNVRQELRQEISQRGMTEFRTVDKLRALENDYISNFDPILSSDPKEKEAQIALLRKDLEKLYNKTIFGQR